MFVHLDIGWMSHPFPLSSFKDRAPRSSRRSRAGPAARALEPAHSERPKAVLTAAAKNAGPQPRTSTAAGAPTRAAGRARCADRSVDVTASGRPSRCRTRPRKGRASPGNSCLSQREAHKLCERQFAEAARACKQALDLVAAKPAEARAQAEALTQALVDKMLGEQELCIRLLTEAAGEKASMHAMNVAVISLLMGRCFGFSAEEIADLGVGAMLHDIGKLEMPLRLRHREDNFSPREQRVYEEHVRTASSTRGGWA